MGGGEYLRPPIVLDSLRVNKYAVEQLDENKVIHGTYSDFRYFLSPQPINTEASIEYPRNPVYPSYTLIQRPQRIVMHSVLVARRGHIGFTLSCVVVVVVVVPLPFFSKSLPLLFQSVDREVNKNTQ